MKYSILVEVYAELEKHSGKIKKAEVVSELLKETPAADLEQVVLLLGGRVFPVWSDKEVGVAIQLMIRAVSRAAGISPEEVQKQFNKSGDLGLTAEELSREKKQRSFGKKELTVEHIFEGLRKLAEVSGAGSQERKLDFIAELLISAKPLEARYIVRTVLEQLRVGVAEGIVRDAIAKAYSVSPEDVENAWFLNQDYGEIARIAKEEGTEGLKKVRIKIGNPVFVLLAEKAPTLKEAIESFEKVGIEQKIDGARLQVHRKGNQFWVYTRRLENVTKQFPDIIEYCKKGIRAENYIVEGECVAVDKKTERPLPFQALSQRIKRKYDIEKTLKEIPAKLNLFDVVFLDGESLFEKTLEERRALLEKIVFPQKGKIELLEQLRTKNLKEADQFYRKALNESQEGVMVKNLEALYQPGRRVAGGWLKVKPTLENLDLVIVGGTWGTGKRAGWIGSLLLGCRDPDTGKFLDCGMMGTGVKEKETEGSVTFEQLTKLLKPLILSEKESEVKFKPKIVIEVAYEEIQKSPTYESGFGLRFPRFLRIRTDKAPEEADSLERLKTIYGQQKGKK
ncbi:MAG: ATP-dependent DNA ligase [Candidatus Aenigmarchaeota archaeon]|nr:ATP-dependent DNA ligase [Candidatus Aenigmarchaeota archaeon]